MRVGVKIVIERDANTAVDSSEIENLKIASAVQPPRRPRARHPNRGSVESSAQEVTILGPAERVSCDAVEIANLIVNGHSREMEGLPQILFFQKRILEENIFPPIISRQYF